MPTNKPVVERAPECRRLTSHLRKRLSSGSTPVPKSGNLYSLAAQRQKQPSSGAAYEASTIAVSGCHRPRAEHPTPTTAGRTEEYRTPGKGESESSGSGSEDCPHGRISMVLDDVRIRPAASDELDGCFLGSPGHRQFDDEPGCHMPTTGSRISVLPPSSLHCEPQRRAQRQPHRETTILPGGPTT